MKLIFARLVPKKSVSKVHILSKASGFAFAKPEAFHIYFLTNSTPKVPGPQWQDTVQPALVS